MQQLHFKLLYCLKHLHIASHISTSCVWPLTHMFKHTLNSIFQGHIYIDGFYYETT